MKTRFIMFRRAGIYYAEDTTTGKQTSLRTRDEAEAVTLLNAKNESFRQPVLNLQLARAYGLWLRWLIMPTMVKDLMFKRWEAGKEYQLSPAHISSWGDYVHLQYTAAIAVVLGSYTAYHMSYTEGCWQPSKDLIWIAIAFLASGFYTDCRKHIVELECYSKQSSKGGKLWNKSLACLLPVDLVQEQEEIFKLPLHSMPLKRRRQTAPPTFDGDCGKLSLPGKLPWPVRGNLPQTPGRFCHIFFNRRRNSAGLTIGMP